MAEEITLKVRRLFVGQILVALEEGRDVWACTEAFFRDGVVPEDRLIKEASGASDAAKMVQFYQEIIDCVERQVPAIEST